MDTFETWYTQLHPRLHAAIRVTCGSAEEADDVVAEAFERAAARWSRVQRMANPDGWTYRVAFNLARRRHGMRRREAELVTRAAAPAAATADVGAEDIGASTRRFVDLVTPLPDRMREVLVLRHVADLTEPQIAEVLGISRGTVSSTLRDGHRRVAAHLESLEHDPRAPVERSTRTSDEEAR
jgi:RNA polymerase sigma factor (sigma-70 family)